MVLPSGREEGRLSRRARGGRDETSGDLERALFASSPRAPANTLHIGLRRTPKRFPGEGSPDDATVVRVVVGGRSVVFENDVLNEGLDADLIQIEPLILGWPAGVDVAVRDTSGNEFQSSSATRTLSCWSTRCRCNNANTSSRHGVIGVVLHIR